MSILTEIIETKKQEVNTLKQTLDPNRERTAPLVSFLNQFNTAPFQVIAEFKRASPSKGIINDTLDPVTQAKTYEQYGAGMISVLTDREYFKGSMDDLVAVKQVVNIPVLNKEFIIDPIQLDLAYQSGADVVLLIVSALTDQELRDLYHYATGLGLEVLVEVHDKEELMAALALGCPLIGINNRNLKTFTTSINQTLDLMKAVDLNGVNIISESGMKEVADVLTVKRAGASGVLVGETLMTHDPKQMIGAFLHE
ncbi:indole-3-glycerol phosphate synthase [Halolactibacillus miurensis]|uniref:Indole-3-glycerol phosphate synthase n=1 Tax=Halolactibacillus miurensis TaxID=306541 RepID=A0A1I6Q5Q8_9BACI|nr:MULTISPECIES: indole-3-glycerol phosphate synthase TrpC [Halolactibacillus]GEM03265.1 indole-3-glycerol phosphate synthase [Halolactibacillus miurensis]SFS47819.1 indole-3-glycerol phosphate synthase [Halolactibacillus miurensis]